MFELKRGSTLTLATLFLSGMCGSALAAAPADWSDIEAKSIVLFYPGQSTYDWLLSETHKKGYEKVPAGARCFKCHEEDEESVGEARIDASELDGIADKSPTIEMDVQAAYDAANLYLRFQWLGDSEGSSEKADALGLLIDDGSVKRFDKQGCWLTCHNGMPDTDNEAGAAAVGAHPLFSGKKDVKKYLSQSRTADVESWDKTKSADEIAALRNSGVFLDLIQWHAGSSKVVDGSVLDYRTEDTGGQDVTVLDSSFDDGTYTVVLQRKLDTGHPTEDKIMKAGGVYTLGIAVHDNDVDKRFHHTAFPISLGLGAEEADLMAAEQ